MNGLCYSHQTFSLPDAIVFHITKNPSTPKGYQKLIQSCKYFFAKNPILVIPGLKFDEKTGWQFLLHDTRFKNDIYQLFPFNRISSKVWVTRRLELSSSIQSSEAVSELLQKLFQCDAWFLSLANQIIPFDDLLFLTKNVSKCELTQSIIKSNNFDVTLEAFIARHPKLRSIMWKSAYLINVKNLIGLPKIRKIKFIILFTLSEEFDIDTFYAYLKDTKYTEARLHYSHPISDVYKDKLDRIIDEAINAKHFKFFPPYIVYLGISREKKDALNKICSDVYSKIRAFKRAVKSLHASVTAAPAADNVMTAT